MIGQRQQGMTLVELMVGMVLAFVISGVIGSLYVTNKQVTRVNDSISRLQESGRFAMHVFEDDLRMAGFSGICGNVVSLTSVLNSAAYPYRFNIGITGFHGTGASWSPALDASIAGLSPAPLPDHDVVTIRRFEMSPVALTAAMSSPTDDLKVEAGSALANGDLLLVADCTAATAFQVTSYGGGNIGHNTGAGSPGNSTKNLGRAFGTDALVYRLVTRTYYIAPSARKPGSNSLWVNSSPSYPGVVQPEELIEGVEQLLLLYGEDTDATPDRAANKYVTAENVGTWSRVVSVRLQTLLGTTSDGTTIAPQPYTFNGVTSTPTDRRLRTPLTSVITLRNRVL
jgi:type IV pilus assembly protein PilW